MEASQSPESSAPPAPAPAGGGRNPRTIRLLAIIVIVIVALSGLVVAYVITAPSACNFQSTNPLVFDQPERPDTLDPHVTFSTPGWGIVQQVYQSMVNYNGSKYTDFVGVLAKNWTHTADGFNWTFYLRHDVHFSNGDAFNAYVMWYSLYRALVMNQAGSFILQENFWYPGVNYYSDVNLTNSSRDWVAGLLNSYDFVNPNAGELAVMMATNQSFQVIDRYTIQLNLGTGYLSYPSPVPYTYLLASIAGPIASAVDPIWVSTNGGVPVNDVNSYTATHTMGTGPYVLKGGFLDLNAATKYTLDPDSGYWAISDAKNETWNNIIQPGKSSLEVDFQPDPAVTISDLKTGRAISASFAYIGPSTINSLQGVACINVNALDNVYGSTAGAWWIYMNQNTPPFNNLSVRQAVVHAINYDRIINVAFGGYAKRWVGPVPLGYPGYNPDNLAPYDYNLTKARAYMNESPWPGGYPQKINYEYVNLGDWASVASFLADDLSKIGLDIQPVAIPNIDALYGIQGMDSKGNCIAQTTANGGPFPIGQEFYTSDYISPDDWTQNNAISYGSANACMAGYSNATMDSLVIDAATNTSASGVDSDYRAITRMMYDNYTDAWLVVPTQFQVVNSHLAGFVTNPMGAALPFVVMQNTMYATKG